MTDDVSADTDDLDDFVEHGDLLQGQLLGTWETLARQRNHLLSSGIHAVVDQSEITTLDTTIGFMADLDRFVGDISTALKRHGADRGGGRFRAQASIIDRQLGRADDQRLDAIATALEAEGLDSQDAERIRDEIEVILEYDPRFQIGGATVSEPRELAAVIVANIDQRAADLIGANHITSSTLHAEPRLSVERLSADLYYGAHADEFVPAGALNDALRKLLSDDDHQRLHRELADLEGREQRASVSLGLNADAPVVLDGDTGELNATARELYDDNLSGPGLYRTQPRLNEPEIAYQLQKIAETDPGRALGIKLMLDDFLSPHERAELDRVLATGGGFGERVDLAFAHPVEGLTGAAKGASNDSVGWWADYWADAQVVIANGFYGLATNSTGSEHGARVPQTWDGNASIVELEFELDNSAERGGADAAFAVELASAFYGGGKAGLSIVRIGRRYFLRSGDELVASIGPDLATKLDEGAEVIPTVSRSVDGSDVAATVDGVTIPESRYQRVPAPGRPGHAIDGNINGFGDASGGHYLRSPNIRITRTLDVAPNGVVQAESQLRGSGGRWVTKVDRKGDPAVSTFFPRSWSRRKTALEIDTAFKNSVPKLNDAELPHHKPPPPPRYWQGRSSDGILIEGRYKAPGDPSQGWDSAYPVFERR